MTRSVTKFVIVVNNNNKNTNNNARNGIDKINIDEKITPS